MTGLVQVTFVSAEKMYYSTTCVNGPSTGLAKCSLLMHVIFYSWFKLIEKLFVGNWVCSLSRQVVSIRGGLEHRLDCVSQSRQKFAVCDKWKFFSAHQIRNMAYCKTALECTAFIMVLRLEEPYGQKKSLVFRCWVWILKCMCHFSRCNQMVQRKCRFCTC